MKFTYRYDLLETFIGEAFRFKSFEYRTRVPIPFLGENILLSPTNCYKLIISNELKIVLNPIIDFEVEILEEQGDYLKKLVENNEFSKIYIGELAWFLKKAQNLVTQEEEDLKLVNSFREALYKPQILNSSILSPEEKMAIWRNHVEKEQGLSEKEKRNRDRKLFKEIQILLKTDGELKKAKLVVKGIELNLESSYFLQPIQTAIQVKAIPMQLQHIIDIIGIDEQNQNKPKIQFYQKRKDFTSNLYRFLNVFIEEEANIYLIGSGLLYIAGFTFPFQHSSTKTHFFNFKNIKDKNNKKYADYFRDISNNDIFVKFEKSVRKHKKGSLS